jgi:hypothetical protein
MRLGAYRGTPQFAYPGWRLTVPGGPAGGHYKGFTHTQAAGTTILPEDQYEQDRGDGMSSHDAVHASPRNPRGVYRSSGEVPPRPNASGALQTYRGHQTRRHAGSSEAPGSFPADFKETGEDDFLSLAENAPRYLRVADFAPNLLGAVPMILDDPNGSNMLRYPFKQSCPSWGCGPMPIVKLPNTVATPPSTSTTPTAPSIPFCAPQSNAAPPPGYQWVQTGVDGNNCPIYSLQALPGATSTVTQPYGTLAPAPPSPSVPVYTVPPVSPQPSPVVATNEVIPLNDGSGNYINISNGAIVSAATVSQNLATMQLTTASAVAGQLIPDPSSPGNYINPQTGAVIPGAALSQSAAATTTTPAAATTTDPWTWLQESTLISGIPNWGLVAAAGVGLALMMGKRR